MKIQTYKIFFFSDTFRLFIYPIVIKQMKMTSEVEMSMLFHVHVYYLLYE